MITNLLAQIVITLATVTTLSAAEKIPEWGIMWANWTNKPIGVSRTVDNGMRLETLPVLHDRPSPYDGTGVAATVVSTRVTNVVQTDNAVYGPDYSQLLLTYPGQFGQRIVTPATERYLTTTVTEHTQITVPLSDGPAVFTHDKLLSSVTAILKKLEDWQPAGLRTNSVGQQNLTFLSTNVWTTNVIVYPHGGTFFPN